MSVVAVITCLALIILSSAKWVVEITSSDELSNMGVERKS
jgi:hypothetical protein